MPQQSEQIESLVTTSESVEIQNNNLTAIQHYVGAISYIRGCHQYSIDQHKIRFVIHRNNLSSCIGFGISSKIDRISQWPPLYYGWRSDNAWFCAGKVNGDDKKTINDL
jgi:hypothetical protein